jgi:hypothetical protein
MRKVLYILPPIALVLCLVLALMMTGVLQLPQILPPTTSTQGTSGTTTAPTISGTLETENKDWIRQNMISISLPEMTDTIVSADNVILFRHTFQDVVLSTPNPQVNEAVTLDLLQRMDVNAAAVAQLADLVQYYTPGTVWNTLYYELLYTPTRIDSAILSLKGTEGVYSGSGQASYNTVCVNYYMPTGSAMTLSEILSEESGAQDGLLQALLKVLAHNATQWGLFEDYSEPVIRYFPSYLQQESIWYFSQEGLNICFAPYEIAPHSSGTVIATIPYEDLTGIIRSDLLPAEQSQVTGSVEITDFADAALDPYTHFSECILSAEGENYLITTDTILYDVCLELGVYEDGRGFIPSSTVFAANSLCSDQAIRLCWEPGKQQLRLSCFTGGKVQSFQLTLDTNGNICLQEISAHS